MSESLPILLRIAAALQLTIAGLNLFLPRLLGWRDDLARMPLLMREVFHVHAWFVSITLVIFAALTWRFATDLAPPAAGEITRWLAACIGLFWTIRTAIQVVYYSKAGPTAIHITLLAVYGGMSMLYLACALGE